MGKEWMCAGKDSEGSCVYQVCDFRTSSNKWVTICSNSSQSFYTDHSPERIIIDTGLFKKNTWFNCSDNHIGDSYKQTLWILLNPCLFFGCRKNSMLLPKELAQLLLDEGFSKTESPREARMTTPSFWAWPQRGEKNQTVPLQVSFKL